MTWSGFNDRHRGARVRVSRPIGLVLVAACVIGSSIVSTT
jgi:hypothetical protein